MHKPLSFARYPKWDLNLAAERKALLAVAIGAAISLGSSDLWRAAGVSLHRRRAILRRVLPLHDSGVRYLPAIAACARGMRAVPRRPRQHGLHRIQRFAAWLNSSRPFKTTTRGRFRFRSTALRPVRVNCERCHWPANFFGSREVRRVYFLSDEQNTRWEIDMLVRIGGGGRLADGARMGIHWHVASKVEYVASDPERQNITWVRAVDPKSGIAKVYTTQPQTSTTTPAGEIRTMDCVDCHNRPSHILQAPDRSVNLALANGAIGSVSSVH